MGDRRQRYGGRYAEREWRYRAVPEPVPPSRRRRTEELVSRTHAGSVERSNADQDDSAMRMANCFRQRARRPRCVLERCHIVGAGLPFIAVGKTCELLEEFLVG